MERFTFALGPGVFVVIVLVGVAGLIWDWDGLKLADFLAATAAGAGLLAVGHGLHRTSRMRSTTHEAVAPAGTHSDRVGEHTQEARASTASTPPRIDPD